MVSDRFKVIYDNLTATENQMIAEMKFYAERISQLICMLERTRESALALTNLEQGMMWAIKAVCLQSEKDK